MLVWVLSLSVPAHNTGGSHLESGVVEVLFSSVVMVLSWVTPDVHSHEERGREREQAMSKSERENR